jgi:Protein of unknown function (DUF3224)
MNTHAAGTFDITINPQLPYDTASGAILSRVSISKVFHGDLRGVSTLEMLSAITTVSDSAGYVAIEHVTGTLLGRAGGFVLQHSGTMTRGKPELRVSVVPDTGTGELTGIRGSMVIEIIDDKHVYEFDFTVAPVS